MAAQYVVVALKVENIHSGWLSSGKLVAPKEDNIQSGKGKAISYAGRHLLHCPERYLAERMAGTGSHLPHRKCVV